MMLRRLGWLLISGLLIFLAVRSIREPEAMLATIIMFAAGLTTRRVVDGE
jgi:hypothetical protein